ncbi:MAG: GNAT family N-acetyltransferase [Gemmatimonadaceae bacterium]|nr:GNAT family N-acetyltransferase [Gemmatimonadaceae bacterium]
MLHIDIRHTKTLPRDLLDELLTLCEAAYEEPLAQEFRNVGPGLHACGRLDGRIVSHAMIVDRTVITDGITTLRTAYVELVATHPAHQHRGYATAVLRALVPHMQSYDIAALSPSESGFYARLGWELWRGPLAVRTDSGEEPSDAEEEVMILRLPRTPASLNVAAPLSVEWRPGDAW